MVPVIDPEMVDSVKPSYAVFAVLMPAMSLTRIADTLAATARTRIRVRFASAGARSAFADELMGEIARLVDKHHDGSSPGGRPFRFVLAGYPAAKP